MIVAVHVVAGVIALITGAAQVVLRKGARADIASSAGCTSP